MSMIVAGLTVAPPIDVDETVPTDLPKRLVPEHLAVKKSEAYRGMLQPGDILVTADTIVLRNDRILGKPNTEEEACEMLHFLSDNIHEVITGVCICDHTGRTVTFSDTTQVSFDKLTDQEITSYVEAFRPLDKAGAYGIQEWIGAVAVKGIKGSYYNVMGLPVHRVYKELTREFGYNSTPVKQ